MVKSNLARSMTVGIHLESIDAVSKKLRSGTVTSIELTELMLNRIVVHDNVLNAFITVTADLAREQAARADQELQQGRDRGPLHGIPITVKDLFCTKGIRTTCGSKLFEHWVPDYDATAVKRLCDAGSVMLGKNGMHELAYGGSSINPFFGAIGNPWDPTHDPGGSSGGSASAVAAGLAYAALGTDTGCSIRQPAHCCGIVGHKPTFGLVSKTGAAPLLRSMDHAGPLARSVKDAAYVLDAIAGYDCDDPYSFRMESSRPFSDCEASIEGKRIGVVRRFFFDGYPDVIEAVDAALTKLVNNGAILVELDVPDIEAAFESGRKIYAEANAVHGKNLIERPDAFSDELRAKLEGTLKITAADYSEAQYFRHAFTRRMEELLSSVDALATPTATIVAAPIDDRPSDYGKHAWKNTGIFDFTGQPSISIPCGFTDKGLPVGLMLTGCLFEDRKVLQLAHAAECALDCQRSPPRFEGE